MKKICIVVSTPMTVKAFLLKHIELLEKDYIIYVVSDEKVDFNTKYGLNVISHKIPINRKIDILKDIKSIYLLYKFFSKEKFDLVLSVTPKAGLVSSIASFFSKIPNRLHFFTGQVWATKKGLFRFVLKKIDTLIASLNTINLTDSFSQRDFLVSEKVVQDTNIKVLHKGSISGVNTNKFKLDQSVKNELKKKYDIKSNEIVFMFLGRLNTDKGIYDLVKAFDILFSKYEDIKLFLIGPDEENISSNIEEFLSKNNVIRIDYVEKPQDIMNVADILVLPSYREGFGTTVIEAASIGIPCVASNIYGLSDAVVDNKTGLLHKVKDVSDIVKKCEYFILNKQQINIMGTSAKQRVETDFKDEILSHELRDFIKGILK